MSSSKVYRVSATLHQNGAHHQNYVVRLTACCQVAYLLATLKLLCHVPRNVPSTMHATRTTAHLTSLADVAVGSNDVASRRIRTSASGCEGKK